MRDTVGVFALGMLLLIVGVAIVVPSGAAPGSAAHRIVRVNLMNVDRTPGYQRTGAATGWRRAVLRVLLGMAIVALGLWCMSVGWPEGV